MRTILQDVLILATGPFITNSLPLVGQDMDREIKVMNLDVKRNFNTITLELDPYQVQKTILVQLLCFGLFKGLNVKRMNRYLR